MIALHYAFSLAQGYDMSRIRARALEKGPLFDNMSGLAWKAFLARERDGVGSNEYATFYLWRSEDAARQFLLGDNFRAVAATFGRPAVHLWTVARSFLSDSLDLPEAATLTRRQVDQGDPAIVLREEEENMRAAFASDGLHSCAIALDASRWEVVRFALWRDAAAIAERPSGKRYDVLYVAREDAVRDHFDLTSAALA